MSDELKKTFQLITGMSDTQIKLQIQIAHDFIRAAEIAGYDVKDKKEKP